MEPSSYFRHPIALLIIVVAYSVPRSVQLDYSKIQGYNTNLGEAVQFLREWENEAITICNRVATAQWTYATNITEYNKKHMTDEQKLQSKFNRVSWRKASDFMWTRISDPVVQRQLKILALKGPSNMPDSKLNEIHTLLNEMKDIYAKTKICPFSKRLTSYCELSLEPDLVRIMANSRDYEELLYTWRTWRDSIGQEIRPKYTKYVELINRAAMDIGFEDAGEQQIAMYENANFKGELENIWSSLEPIYKQLHSFVRRKLVSHYGVRRVKPDGPIPAHLLGNMWAQNWKNIIDLVIPYPGKRRIDVTAEMLRQGYTPLKMFQITEEFFTSLGLKAMPVEFWHNSVFEKPSNRPISCKASAWDFCDKHDYRIKQCTEVTMDDLFSTHHEMAHIQYYLHYADQPFLFKDGANAGFHEALSDAIILSVSTPRHLHRIGLLNNITDDYEAQIDFLMEMALDKIAYLPFAYSVDLWRWGVFSKGQGSMNARWWDLKLLYQGIVPPVVRDEKNFDPSSKYHVIADAPYIKYFISIVLQFQMHSALCTAAGHVGPMHKCDIYRSKEAGRLLSEVMASGYSKPWPQVIKMLTGGRTSALDVQPFIEYFKPLTQWLINENKADRVGWSRSNEDIALFESLSKSSSQRSIDRHLMVLVTLSWFKNMYY
ncbi:angiotensin-converting enzyme-like [Adelges cooleyi]|uniref:angiotensin-converting enzyme-like n=1 Tax=Adelges cooleyi TaxID=133065 RepID=UPI0021801ABE|nr:angiotensin-converting enzyme-like [Adelges cooleyi]